MAHWHLCISDNQYKSASKVHSCAWFFWAFIQSWSNKSYRWVPWDINLHGTVWQLTCAGPKSCQRFWNNWKKGYFMHTLSRLIYSEIVFKDHTVKVLDTIYTVSVWSSTPSLQTFIRSQMTSYFFLAIFGVKMAIMMHREHNTHKHIHKEATQHIQAPTQKTGHPTQINKEATYHKQKLNSLTDSPAKCQGQRLGFSAGVHA